MSKLIPLIIILYWGLLVVNRPYIIALLFIQILLLGVLLLGGCCKFIGFILFLIYVRGIIILFSYCVMLMPFTKISLLPCFPVVAFIFYSDNFLSMSYAYGLLFSFDAVLLIGVLLFLVILCVVDIIDYSCGYIK